MQIRAVLCINRTCLFSCWTSAWKSWQSFFIYCLLL